MSFLLIVLCIVCICLSWLYFRLRGDIRSLCGQLEELERGSHMELATNTRQKCLLLLCRKLNLVLSAKDRNYIQYEKAEKLLKQNITNLAHDIRTPLTGASGYLQLARESCDSGKREHYLQNAENRLTELEDMLEKLFLYTKLTGEDFVLPPESRKKIQVLPLLGDCLLHLYARFEKNGTEPKIEFESEDFRVFAEEEALRRIFLNLIQNALVHGTGELTVFQKNAPFPETIAAKGETLTETAAVSEEKVSYLIFENPVSPDCDIDTARIFERFYKADPARGRASSGLGLFIVRELMRKMDGEAAAEIHGGKLQIILSFPIS